MAALGSVDSPGAGDTCEVSHGVGEPSPVGDRECGRRRSTLAATLCACVLGGWLLLGSVPALALSQRGHHFSFSFGKGGNGIGQFSSPSAIAVNDATGDLYVADRANNRVEEFEPVVEGGALTEEKFVRQFEVPNPEGIAVDNSTSEADPSKGDVYVAGATKRAIKEEEFEDKVVYKFTAAGEAITKLKKFRTEKGEAPEEFEPIEGLGVDSSGNLLVYDEEGEIAIFDDAAKNKSKSSIEAEFSRPAPGLAVDSHGDLYVGHESEDSAAAGPEGEPPVVGTCEVEVVERECEVVIPELDEDTTTAVAVNTASVPGNLVSEEDDSYIANVAVVGSEKVTTVAAFGPGGSPIQRFGVPREEESGGGSEEGTGVAVDSSTGTVYVADAAADRVDVFGLEPPGPPRIDSLSSCATSCLKEANARRLDAEVDPAGEETHASLEYGLGSCPSACVKTPEVDLGGEFGDQPLEGTLKSLGPGTYHFRVLARNHQGEASAEETFTIASTASALPDGRAWEMVSPPNKDGYEPEPIVGQGGTIEAARDGSAITYVADGPIPAEGEPEGNRLPEEPQILSVRGSTGWVSQDIATPNSAASGVREGASQEYQAFSPNLSLALLEPFVGSSVTSPLAEPPLSPPQEFEVEGKEAKEAEQEKTIDLRDDAPLAPEPPSAPEHAEGPSRAEEEAAHAEALASYQQEQASYTAAQENGKLMRNAGFLALVTEANALGVLGGMKQGDARFGGGAEEGLETVTATPDLGHVLFKSWKAVRGLYEWGPNRRLQRVNALPNVTGTVTEKSKIISSITLGEASLSPGFELSGGGIPYPGTKIVKQIGPGEWEMSSEATSTHSSATITVYATGTVVFGDAPDVRHATSNTGSLVFWTDVSGGHLYVRNTETQETLQLDPVTSGTGEGTPSAHFQTASADGTRVFFTDSQRLTAASRASQNPIRKPDLYVFELTHEKPLSGTLTDLTPEGAYGESAAVQGRLGSGGVLGASEGGSYVYFVANAALAAGDTPGDCSGETEAQEPGRTCNLYMRHFDGTSWAAPKLIAVLSNEDAPDWGGSGFPGDLAATTSRVSPDGEYLAFMSDRSLTGYDNEDRTSKTPGEREDEEVFLYDASRETLVCASCDPSGTQPAGVFDPGSVREPGSETEGVGLLVDRPQVWGALIGAVDHWLGGSVPGWTPISIERALYQSRYLSNSGRLFFNSPDLLVPAVAEPYEKALAEGKDPVSKEKVYEYEPDGVGSCTVPGGCIGLLSAPNSAGEAERERESAFLDASENGDDVFFLTAARLPAVNGVAEDVDSNFDIYDARVCDQAPSFSCLPAPAVGKLSCGALNTCRGTGTSTPGDEAPASETVSVAGNVSGAGTPASAGTLPSKVTAKPLTRAQKLAKAIKACRKDRKKSRRLACEKRARKQYGPIKAKARKSTGKGKRK